jgi:hypothetical protein
MTGTPTFVPCAWRGWLEVEELAKSVEFAFSSRRPETTLHGWAKVGGGRRFSAVEAPQVQANRIQVWLTGSEESYSAKSDRLPTVWESDLSFGRDETTGLPSWWSFRVRMPFEDLDKLSASLSSGRLVDMTLHVVVDGLLAPSTSGDPEVAFFPDDPASYPGTMKLVAEVSSLSFDELPFAIGEKEALAIGENEPPTQRDTASDISNCLKPLESLTSSGLWAIIALTAVLWFRR